MTTNYHTPISDGDSNAASTVNTPLGTLDAQLTTNTSEITTARGAYGNLDARLDALVAAGGNVATLTEDSATANGATTINVDSTTGLIVGARIVYTLSDGNLEYNTIATIPDGTSITVDTGVDSGGSATIPGNTYLAMISPSEYAAATAINYGNSVTPTLADAVQWAAGNVHNVLAYGAAGDSGTTNNTTAFAAVVTAASAGDVMLIPRASGYYEVDTTVTISKAMTIVIQGEVRSGDTAATPTESVFKITASNCKVIFEGGKIRGYGNYTSDSTPPSLIWCEGTSTANPIRNVDIINPHLEEPPSAAIWFRYCNDSRVMGGLIEDRKSVV